MEAIVTALLNPILPIFAIAALGFVFGRMGVFDGVMAATLNKFVIMVALPALLFSFLASAPFEEFDWFLIGIYFSSSLIIYLLGFLVMRFLFRLELKEAILMGMAGCFTNHVFFVLYIATILYGDGASLPILAVIAFDAFLIFGGTFLLLDLMKGGKTSVVGTVKILAKNPMLIALAVGMIVGWGNVPIHEGILTYAKFVGGAAAPTSMFALGVVLAGVSLIKIDGSALVISGFKLVLHPALVLGAFVIVAGANINDDLWMKTLFFTAAGPAGAMPFVLALQHNVDTSRIVRAIIYSTVFSLLTLAVLA